MELRRDPAFASTAFRFGEDVMQSGARFIPDMAARLEIWFAISGAATVTFEDSSLVFEAGQGIVVQTPALYLYEQKGDAPHMLTWCLSEPLSAMALPGLTQRTFPITPMMTMLIELGLAAERRPAAIRDALSLHLGRALLVEVVARLDNRSEEYNAQSTAERLRALIAAAPRHDWTLDRMARTVGMSARTLSRQLALVGAPSAGELLWRARVRQGAELLVRSRASCTDIADLCGFQNVAHFSRRIRQTTGMTAVEIRRWAVSASLSDRADFFQGIETGGGAFLAG